MSFGKSGPDVKILKSGSKIVTYSLGKVRIHTYISPESSFGDTTHIIESKNYLVLVDAQYLKEYAIEFREYADSLNKPGSIVISHSHPDHYLGLKYFSDIDRYALEEVKMDIEQKGEAMLKESRKMLGDKIADTLVTPNKILVPGTVVLDNVTYKYTKVQNAEADVQLVIELPELKVIIVQDLVYSGYHPWLSSIDLSGWITALENLKKLKYTMVLVGHGNPTTPASYDSMIRYLTYAQAVVDRYIKNPEKFKKALVTQYPRERRKGANIIDMYLEYLK